MRPGAEEMNQRVSEIGDIIRRISRDEPPWRVPRFLCELTHRLYMACAMAADPEVDGWSKQTVERVRELFRTTIELSKGSPYAKSIAARAKLAEALILQSSQQGL